MALNGILNRGLRCAVYGVAVWALAQMPGYAQMPAPGAGMPSVAPMGADFNLAVTNMDFKRFDPDYAFDKGKEMYPACVTKRAAIDYVAWLQKEMGKDFIWRAIPKSEQQLGLIYVTTMIEPEEGMKNVSSTLTPPEGMVYVPSGPFIMGSDVGDADEQPQHEATTGRYFIDKYEVSNAEFKAVFSEFTFKEGREDYPAIVTWQQASAYAERVGKRLPTEAEWEKAARGIDGRTFPWGESYDPSYVSWDENDPRGGSPARPESPYGCIDMAGGAWEWTAGWYKPYPGNDEPCDAYGERYRVMRGGASFNDVAMIRTSHRYCLPPDTTGNYYVGFRCVKDID